MNGLPIASSFTSPMNQRRPCLSDAEGELRITFDQSVSRSMYHRAAICPNYLRPREMRSKSISTLLAISILRRESCRDRIQRSRLSNLHIGTKSRKSFLHVLGPTISNYCLHKVSSPKSYGWPMTFK